MPGSTPPWDQSEDPRDSTVDLPRVDLAKLADYFAGSAPPPASLASAGPASAGPASAYSVSADPAPAGPGVASTAEAEPTAVPAPAGLPEAPGNGSAADDTRVNGLGAVGPAAPGNGAGTANGADPGNGAGTANRISAADPANGIDTPDGTTSARSVSNGAATSSHYSAGVPYISPDRSGRPVTRSQQTVEAEARPDEYARPRRQQPGSLADLRSRLGRLPDGHPSAPYDDDGRAKPPPIRIKQLELGLPAPARELSDSQPWNAASTEIHADPADGHPGESARDEFRTSIAKAERELPDPLAERGRLPEYSGNGSGEDSPSRAPQWEDPYAADSGGNGHSGISAAPGSTADLPLGPWNPASATRPPGAVGDDEYALGNGSRRAHGGRSAESNGRELGRDNGDRPDGADRNGRSAVRRNSLPHQSQPLEPLPPEPLPRRSMPPRRAAQRHTEQQGTGQREAAAHLGPSRAESTSAKEELTRLVDHALAGYRAAEGRNMFGGYGTSGLTPVLQRLAAQLPVGGLAPGSEDDTLKPADRLAAKLSRLVARNPGRSPEELAAEISDGVRYAFVFEPSDYAEATWLVHRKLKTQGFELEVRRNRWESPEYKGIFTCWRDPAHDLLFEVQFHTTASWAVHKRTHDAYVRITDPATAPDERAELRARQVAASAAAKSPPGYQEIADFRPEQR
jgi:hypothetical protein